MTVPDYFGVADSVRQLTPPPGLEAVHQDGFSWARQGRDWTSTTRISPAEWNLLIAQLRGLLTTAGVNLDDLPVGSPLLLREALLRVIATQTPLAARDEAVTAAQQALAYLGEAEAARDAARLSDGLYASTAQGIGLGVRSIAITAAGSGGTNGTWPWATTGGTAVIGATGTVTIAGGAVVAVDVNQHGLYTVAPTAITITGAGALTGFTYAMTNAVNTAVNGYFSVPVAGSDTAANLYRVDAGPVATLIAGYASAASLAEVTVGQSAPVAANGGTTAGYTWILPAPVAAANTYATEFGFYAAQAGQGSFLVMSVDGGGNLTVIHDEPLDFDAGLNAFPALMIDAPLGAVFGLYSTRQIVNNLTAGTAGMWRSTAAVKVGTATAKTAFGTGELQFYVKTQAELRAHADVAFAMAEDLRADLGKSILRGEAAPAGTGTLAGSAGTFYFKSITAEAEVVTAASFYVNVAGTGRLVVSTLSGGTKTDIYVGPLLTLTAGLNTVEGLAIDLPAGASVGIQTITARMWLVSGDAAWFSSVAPGTSGAYVSLGYGLQANFRTKSGLLLEVDGLQSAALPAMSGVDNSGAGDVTAAMAAAVAAYAVGAPVYVPSGRYNVTALPRAGLGLWGDGQIYVNGQPFFLPQSPMGGTLLGAARSVLADYIDSGALIVAGESDMQGFYADNFAGEFGSLINSALNLGAEAVPRPVTTLFGTFASRNGATWVGLTPAGTITFADTGPTPGTLAAVLAAGASYTFTGALDSIGVFYDQAVGGGTLTVAVSGGATLGTVNTAAGSPLLTQYASFATGSAASQTYVMTASGGPVTLVGLERVGIVPAIVSGTQRAPKRIPLIMASRGSAGITDWSATERASAVAMASFGGARAGRPLVLLRQGASDAVSGVSTATLQSRIETAIANWQAAGADVLLIAYTRQSNLNDGITPSYPNGHESLIAAHRKAAKSTGAPLIDWSRLPLFDAGLLPDGAHPSATGMYLLARETLAQIGALQNL